MYRGILWMKEKYEQYRDLADKRYEELREELNRTEKRYQDLLATVEESRMRPLSAGGRMTKSETGGERVTWTEGDGERVIGEETPGLGVVVGEETEGEIVLTSGSDVEKDSIRDIVEEKNRQIHFLQSQLDQRIKNYHQLEYQGRDSSGPFRGIGKAICGSAAGP